MKKVIIGLASLWLAFVSTISPVWIGMTYMFSTGHGKGYAYDPGPDEDFYIMIGVFMFFLWLAALVPVMIWLSKTLSRYNRYFTYIPVLIFIIFFVIDLLYVGWDYFIAFFGIGFNRITR